MTTKSHVLDTMKYRIFTFLIVLSISTLVTSQTKDEQEKRIKIEGFPKPAQILCNIIPKDARRTRYYKETDIDKTSYETKFKYKRHWYSVEFDSIGKLEDIEIQINDNELTEKTDNKIKNYFKKCSKRYEIIKIQEQFLYKSGISEAGFLEAVSRNRKSLSPNYEIIVALKIDKVWVLKEVTFSNQGEFLFERIIKPDSYEYIMY